MQRARVLPVLLVVLGLAWAAGCQTTQHETMEVRFPEKTMETNTVLDSRLKHLERMAREYPKRSDIPYQIAGVHYQKEEYWESARALEKAIYIDPQEPKYHYHLGRIYMRVRELEKAQDAFRRSLELMPPGRYTGAHAALGYVLCQLREWDAARTQFRSCLEIDPRDPTPYYFLGCIDDVLRHVPGAVSHLKEYLERGGTMYASSAAHILESHGVTPPRPTRVLGPGEETTPEAGTGSAADFPPALSPAPPAPAGSP